jgi:hypothetical protein
LQGEQGEKGERGESGIQGEKGDQGLQGEKGENGERVLLRTNGDYVEYKYENDKKWNFLYTFFNEKKGGGIIAAGAPGKDGKDGANGARLQIRNYNNNIQYKYESESSWVTLFEVPTSGGEVENMYAKRIENVGDYIYTGEADAGSSEGSAVWRISRTYIDPDTGDVIVVWADGNTDFDNIWSNYSNLQYT